MDPQVGRKAKYSDFFDPPSDGENNGWASGAEEEEKGDEDGEGGLESGEDEEFKDFEGEDEKDEGSEDKEGFKVCLPPAEL